MARSALIPITEVQNHSHLALLPCKDASLYQVSSSEMFGKVQQMPQTGNTRFTSGSPGGCCGGLDREKYVEGEGKFLSPAGVGYLRGDPSKAKDVSGWGAKVRFEEIVEITRKAGVGWPEPRVS